MKRIYIYLTAFILLLLPSKVSASGMSISIRCSGTEVNKQTTCVVTGNPDGGVSAASGSISINGSSVEYVSSSSGALNGNVNSNSFNLYGSTQSSPFTLFTLTFNAKSAGTTTINVTLNYITDGEFNDVTINQTVSGTITVTEPAPQTQPEQPAVQQPTQPSTNTSQPAKQEAKKETVKEDNKKEEVKEEKKEEVVEEKKLDITKFSVVGYDIAFKVDKYNYQLYVDRNVEALYIIVEGNGIEVVGDKEVNIKDKNKIIVNVKEGDISKDYTIKLIRNYDKEKGNIVSKSEDSSNINNILLCSTTCLGITTLGAGVYIINEIRKGKKNGIKKR